MRPCWYLVPVHSASYSVVSRCDRTRTCIILGVGQTLSQLSYTPLGMTSVVSYTTLIIATSPGFEPGPYCLGESRPIRWTMRSGVQGGIGDPQGTGQELPCLSSSVHLRSALPAASSGLTTGPGSPTSSPPLLGGRETFLRDATFASLIPQPFL